MSSWTAFTLIPVWWLLLLLVEGPGLSKMILQPEWYNWTWGDDALTDDKTAMTMCLAIVFVPVEQYLSSTVGQVSLFLSLCLSLGLHRCLCLCLCHCALLNYLFPIVWQVTHMVFWVNLPNQPGSIHRCPEVKISKRSNGKEYNFKTGGKWELFLATCRCRGPLLADCVPPWPRPWAHFPPLWDSRPPRIGGRAGEPTPM